MCEYCDVLDEDDFDDTSDNEVDSDYLDMTLEEVVAAGMAYLDIKYPDHAERVDLDKLDQKSTDQCALAQAAEKDYMDAIRDIVDVWNAPYDERQKWVRSHGFDESTYNGYTNTFDGFTFGQLTNEWRKQYELRHIGQLLQPGQTS